MDHKDHKDTSRKQDGHHKSDKSLFKQLEKATLTKLEKQALQNI